MKAARSGNKKQKAKEVSNEQNSGWKALTEMITTRRMSGSLHIHTTASPIQSLSAALEVQRMPLISPEDLASTVEGGKH